MLCELYFRPHRVEHVPVIDQGTQEKSKFIELEGTGMLLDTLAKNISEYIVIHHTVYSHSTPSNVYNIYMKVIKKVSMCDRNYTVTANYIALWLQIIMKNMICNNFLLAR